MTREAEIHAIRTGVAWTEDTGTVLVRVTGDDALTLMDRVCALNLFVREGEVRLTLLLTEDARVFADAYVGRDDDAFVLATEGVTPKELLAHLAAHTPKGADVHVEELTTSHDTLSLHGPFAWELVGELFGPDLIGLPYLGFYRTGDALCLRGGKTGEYGYDLFVPKADAEAFRGRLHEIGSAFDAMRASSDALDQCMLENGFFNVRREGRAGLSPIELGLQWRVSYGKHFVGALALKEERARAVELTSSGARAGAARRVTSLMSDHPLDEGDAIYFDELRIGTIVAAGQSPTLEAWACIGVLDRPYYHAGIDRFVVQHGRERRPIRTISPPLVKNRSLFVNPQRHAYSTRDEEPFPPLK